MNLIILLVIGAIGAHAASVIPSAPSKHLVCKNNAFVYTIEPLWKDLTSPSPSNYWIRLMGNNISGALSDNLSTVNDSSGETILVGTTPSHNRLGNLPVATGLMVRVDLGGLRVIDARGRVAFSVTQVVCEEKDADQSLPPPAD